MRNGAQPLWVQELRETMSTPEWQLLTLLHAIPDELLLPTQPIPAGDVPPAATDATAGNVATGGTAEDQSAVPTLDPAMHSRVSLLAPGPRSAPQEGGQVSAAIQPDALSLGPTTNSDTAAATGATAAMHQAQPVREAPPPPATAARTRRRRIPNTAWLQQNLESRDAEAAAAIQNLIAKLKAAVDAADAKRGEATTAFQDKVRGPFVYIHLFRFLCIGLSGVPVLL